MRYWVGWMIVAVICAIAEMATPTFFISWFGVGALAAAILSIIGAGFGWQFAGFLAVSLILVFSTKKITGGWLKHDVGVKTNAAAVVGKEGLVVRDIPADGAGQVKVDGETWTAVSQGGAAVPAGVKVTVVDVTGVHLVVSARD